MHFRETSENNSKFLPYKEQKEKLAGERLRQTGFQESNYTNEDGNCFLWALQDQMR